MLNILHALSGERVVTTTPSTLVRVPKAVAVELHALKGACGMEPQHGRDSLFRGCARELLRYSYEGLTPTLRPTRRANARNRRKGVIAPAGRNNASALNGANKKSPERSRATGLGNSGRLAPAKEAVFNCRLPVPEPISTRERRPTSNLNNTTPVIRQQESGGFL